MLAGPRWAGLGRALADALTGADPAAGPMLDFGAGTVLSTIAVADALPEATILAVEPSPSLRALLLSRLAARPDLRSRATVLPTDLFGAELPRRLGGAVAISMLGHCTAQVCSAEELGPWSAELDERGHRRHAVPVDHEQQVVTGRGDVRVRRGLDGQTASALRRDRQPDQALVHVEGVGD